MKWESVKGYRGIRYREHENRKHGIKKDRYFAMRYMLNGKQIEEGLGWASEGMTAEKAAGELAKIKEAKRTGKGATSLKEARGIAEAERQEKEAVRKQAEKESITFSEFYEKDYKPVMESTKKAGSVHAEKIIFSKWINPYIGGMAFRNIFPLHVEKIKKAMLDDGKAARSIEYTLSVIRQIWNQAKRDGLIDRDSPTKQVKKPKFDNKRIAFFTHEQADTLLDNLKEKSDQIHNMALLSLHTGMRASEVFKLKWADIDLLEGLIMVKDAKGGSRVAYMTGEVKAMFQANKPENNRPGELIFKSNTGEMIKQISKTFERIIDGLGYNEGISDRRQRLTFHSLRHTYASWQVMDGTPLYTVQRLLGHSTIKLTERYSHLAPGTLKAAVSNFEKNIKKEREKRASKKVIEMKNQFKG